MAQTSVHTRPIRERLLQTVSDRWRIEGFVSRLGAFLDLEPAQVRSLLRSIEAAAEHSWGPLGNTVRELHFDAGERRSPARCSVVYVRARARFATPWSSEDNWVFVLRGVGVEGGGRPWLPGDLLRVPVGDVDIAASGPDALVFVRVAFARSAGT